jgi:hypothetical protein
LLKVNNCALGASARAQDDIAAIYQADIITNILDIILYDTKKLI